MNGGKTELIHFLSKLQDTIFSITIIISSVGNDGSQLIFQTNGEIRNRRLFKQQTTTKPNMWTRLEFESQVKIANWHQHRRICIQFLRRLKYTRLTWVLSSFRLEFILEQDWFALVDPPPRTQLNSSLCFPKIDLINPSHPIMDVKVGERGLNKET